MRRFVGCMFVVSLTACGRGEGSSTMAPDERAESAQEAPAEAEPAEPAEPPCGRNSSEVCECEGGASGLRVCIEGTWNECACDEDDGFGNDDLAFDDE